MNAKTTTNHINLKEKYDQDPLECARLHGIDYGLKRSNATINELIDGAVLFVGGETGPPDIFSGNLVGILNSTRTNLITKNDTDRSIVAKRMEIMECK